MKRQKFKFKNVQKVSTQANVIQHTHFNRKMYVKINTQCSLTLHAQTSAVSKYYMKSVVSRLSKRPSHFYVNECRQINVKVLFALIRAL